MAGGKPSVCTMCGIPHGTVTTGDSMCRQCCRWYGGSNSAINQSDQINSPSHYTNGPWEEVIDVIDSAVKDPDSFLHGNAIKYLLRAKHKGTFKQDIEKAQWYLNKLVEQNANT